MDPIEPWVDRDELRRLANALLVRPQACAPVLKDATYGDDFVGYAGAQESPQPELPPAPTEPALSPAPAPAPLPVPVPALGSKVPASVPVLVERPAGSALEVNARQALATARQIAQRGGLLAEPSGMAGELPVAEPPPESPPGLLPAAAQLTQVSPLPEPAPAAPPTASTPFVARLQAYGNWLREGTQAKAFFVTDRDGGVLIDEVQSPKLQQVARTLAQASRTANQQAGAAAIGNLHIKIAPENVLEVVPVTTRYGPLILGIIVHQPLSARNVDTVARGLQQVIDGTSTPHSP